METTVSRRTVLACAALAPAVLRAQAYKPEYKMSVVGNVPLGTAVAAVRWADLVRERSQGRINIKVYPGSQLVGGDQTRELVSMRQGVIDMVVSSTINLAPQIREMNLFSLPFLMTDSRAFDALTQGGPVRAALDATLAQRDAVALAWSENGFRQVSNSKRVVRRPEDLKGLKIRFAAGQIYSDIFNALGANPLQMSWADLQPALATGAVDGQETPVNVFLQTKLETVNQKHLSLWNYVADANIFKVHKPVWDSFSAADKDIVRAAAEQAAKEHTASTRKGLGADGDRSSLDELAKRNVKVEELSAQEKQAFGRATQAVYEKWSATTGAELVKAAEAAVKKSG
jgi:tripartite ATP-independent transporter DctP family solute receptor